MNSPAVSLACFLACIVVILTMSDAFVGWALLIGWISLTVMLAGLQAYRPAKTVISGESRPRARFGRMWLIAAAAVAVTAYGYLSLVVLGRAHELALCAVSESNLRAIRDGLHQYCLRYDEPPASFVDLVRAGLCVPGMFISGWDNIQEDVSGRTLRSSYEYINRPAICASQPAVVVYEREPWSPIGLRIFRRYGRQVLLGDGTVGRVDQREFERLAPR